VVPVISNNIQVVLHSPSIEEFEKSYFAENQAILICNPNQQVIYTQVEMSIVKLAKKHDLFFDCR
jgi:hypothetical protein